MVETGRLRQLAERAAVRFPDGPLVVALSGGADSAVAVWLARRSSRDLRALHVHHGLSGSDRLQAAAVEIAARLGTELTVIPIELVRDSEGEARARRYAALMSERRVDEWLVTGHSADDQAETVMMNLLRSSGSDGLAGMSPARWPLARPLLNVWRAELREMADLARLPFVDDPANEELRHLRNRIRARLMPEIEAAYNPSFRQALCQTASVLASESALLDRLDRLRVEVRPDAVRFVTSELATSDPALAARAIRKGITAARPPHPPSHSDLDLVLAVAEGRQARAMVGAGGLVERAGPWLVISWGPGEDIPPARDLEVPGFTSFGRFAFEISTGDALPLRPLSAWSVVLSHEAPLLVRAAGEGGSVAGKDVDDALVEAKVPRQLRRAWPVVHQAGEAVWIPGVRRAGWPGPGRGRYLCAVAIEEHGWERFEL